MKYIICLTLLALVSLASCKSDTSDDPDPVEDHGSWSYRGKTNAGTFSIWTAQMNCFQTLADSSSLQCYFSSTNPTAGTYTVVPFSSQSSITSSQITVAVVDDRLVGISYFVPDYVSGATATVSRTGGKLSVSISNLNLIGFHPSTLGKDSISVSGSVKE